MKALATLTLLTWLPLMASDSIPLAGGTWTPIRAGGWRYLDATDGCHVMSNSLVIYEGTGGRQWIFEDRSWRLTCNPEVVGPRRGIRVLRIQ